MTYIPLNIESYRTELDQQLLELEKKSMQGKMIKLEMVRNSYLSRSYVFHNFFAVAGFNDSGKLVAAGIGAIVPFGINDEIFEAGFGYDVRVAAEWKNKGAGRQLASYITRQSYHSYGLKRNFITLKASNIPVIKLSMRAVGNISLVEFNYLTIPTSIRTGLSKQSGRNQQFFARLLSSNDACIPNRTEFISGLGVWHTHNLYGLKIREIHPLLRMGAWMLEKWNKIHLPKKGEDMSFGCLYNYTIENIHELDEVLLYLQSMKVNWVNVCCRKNDDIWNALKTFSIHTTPSYLLADFTIKKNDAVTIDVRCL